jgi:hypothetical protein
MGILVQIFRKWDMGVWTGSVWLRIGTAFTIAHHLAGSCEYGNKPPGSINCGKFLDYL